MAETFDISLGLAVATVVFALIVGKLTSSSSSGLSSSTGSRIPGLEHVLTLGKHGLVKLLRAGPVPKHVAFCMDGNRRFARKRKQESREGHNAGFDTLSGILEFSYQLGIQTITVFAFSIENFKRSEKEVNNLMEIARTRLLQICENGELADQYGVKVQVLGNRKLLPKDVYDISERVMEMTKNNTRAVLNICCPYTSQDDITSAIKNMVNQAEAGNLDPETIDEAILERNMVTHDSPTLDILIRTSGVERFSDFMLWETKQNTMIEFIPKLWPEFTCWDYFLLLLKWGSRRWQ